MGMTWKVKTSVLLIGLAAATMLTAGCASQDKPENGGNLAADESGAAGKTETKGGEAELEIPPVSIPKHGITLSPVQPQGALLQIGEKRQQFDWTYTTPRMILPRLQASDYDLDGADELSVALNVDSGTGLSVDELHIVESEGDEAKAAESADSATPFVDHVFEKDDYLAQLGNALTFKTSEVDGELFGHLTLNGETTKVSLKSFQTGYNGEVTEKLGFGAIVGFEASANKLIATFGVGIVIENVAEPQYFGEIQADVGYKDGEFQLSSFRFTAEE
ncbi:hypothetical protein [Paenibacillus methanolicus]|uniref:Lipoprotein n=1 Tax=Paenibacillus methanolicus TaxID=582686 RepID=A0A5S5C3Y8_9BACL|nr:hypothetical protein [Paenibacillus methanolicus]TYP74044.1 hypothetical protein BCM02_106325 [Paenibacillus methanolicus]